MPYPTITTFLHDEETSKFAFDWAIAATRHWNAHLNVICAGIDATEPGYYYAGAHALAIGQNLNLAQETSQKLKKVVEPRLQAEDIVYEIQTVTLLNANVGNFIAERGRMSDLIVLPTPYGTAQQQIDVSALETCLFAAKAPVVVIPDDCSNTIQPEKVLLAWNDAPEALQAVRSALPMLKQAKAVQVTIIDPPIHGADRSDPGGRLAQFLVRHGVKPEITILSKNQPSTANQLCQHAAETGCNMIVMGAYGHSRLREAILGGATRDTLHIAQIPVLMSH